jgi:hypothetical protein
MTEIDNIHAAAIVSNEQVEKAGFDRGPLLSPQSVREGNLVLAAACLISVAEGRPCLSVNNPRSHAPRLPLLVSSMFYFVSTRCLSSSNQLQTIN